MARELGTATAEDLKRLASYRVFPGTDPNTTPEQMLDQIDKVLAEIEDGTLEVSEVDFNDD